MRLIAELAYEPLLSTPDVSSSNSRYAVTGGVIGINGLGGNVDRVDLKCLSTKSKSNRGLRVARNGETTLAIRLRSLDGSMDRIGIILWSNDQSGT